MSSSITSWRLRSTEVGAAGKLLDQSIVYGVTIVPNGAVLEVLLNPHRSIHQQPEAGRGSEERRGRDAFGGKGNENRIRLPQ